MEHYRLVHERKSNILNLLLTVINIEMEMLFSCVRGCMWMLHTICLRLHLLTAPSTLHDCLTTWVIS
jgi:hypothetical protein